MQAVLFFLAATAGLARAWPQGQPNCGITGDWTDPEGRERLRVLTGEFGAQRVVHQVIFNSTGVTFFGSSPYDDGRSAALRITGGNESLLLNLVCHNSALWVLQTPLLNSSRLIRVFSLTRPAPPPPPPPPPPSVQPEADVEPTAGSSAPPKYILVNITIPKSISDDERNPNGGDRGKNGDSSPSARDSGCCAGNDCTTCSRNYESNEKNDPSLNTHKNRYSASNGWTTGSKIDDRDKKNRRSRRAHGSGRYASNDCASYPESDDNAGESDRSSGTDGSGKFYSSNDCSACIKNDDDDENPSPRTQCRRCKAGNDCTTLNQNNNDESPDPIAYNKGRYSATDCITCSENYDDNEKNDANPRTNDGGCYVSNDSTACVQNNDDEDANEPCIGALESGGCYTSNDCTDCSQDDSTEHGTHDCSECVASK